MQMEPGLGRAVNDSHDYDEPSGELGIVEFIFEAVRGFDPNKALATASSLSVIAIGRGRLPLALKAIGVFAAGSVALAAVSEISNEKRAKQAARIRDTKRTREILER